MNLENGKGFPLPLPVSGSAHFSLSPPPRGLPAPFPLSSLRGPVPGFGPSASTARVRAPPSPQPLTGRPRAPVSLPGGVHLSDSSSTLSPSRTRPERNHRARFARAILLPPDSSPLNTRPAARNPPTHPEPQPPRRNSPSSPPRSTPQPIRRCSAFESP